MPMPKKLNKKTNSKIQKHKLNEPIKNYQAASVKKETVEIAPDEIKVEFKEEPKTYDNPNLSEKDNKDQNGMRILERLLLRESQPPPPPRQSSTTPPQQTQKPTVQKLLEQLQAKQGPAISVIPIKKERKKQYRPRQIKQEQNSNNVMNKKPVILNGVMDTVARETPMFKNGEQLHNNGYSIPKATEFDPRKQNNGDYYKQNEINQPTMYNSNSVLPSLLINGKYQKPLLPAPNTRPLSPPPITNRLQSQPPPLQMSLPYVKSEQPPVAIKTEDNYADSSFAAALAQFTQMQTAAVAMAMLSNPTYFGNFNRTSSPPRPARSSSTESSNSTGDPIGPLDYDKAQDIARQNLNNIFLNYGNTKQETSPTPAATSSSSPLTSFANVNFNGVTIKNETNYFDNSSRMGGMMDFRGGNSDMFTIKTENERI